MASIFKQKYTTKDKDGQRVRKQSQFWYIDYKDADGIRQRVKGFKDKVATTQLAAQLEREAEQANAGIVDRYKEHRKKPLAAHLDDYKASLLNKGNTAKHACLVYNRARTVINSCGFAFIADVSASKVQGYLADRRRAGLSVRSSNFYLQAVKQFCRWLVADGRAAENPLAYLQGQNVQTDLRHERRALSENELQRLMVATLSGRDHSGLTAKERMMLYAVAVSTGLRASELASLTWGSFDLGDSEASVKVLAAYSKHRRDDVMPLRADLVGQLVAWRDESRPDEQAKVFPCFNPNKAAKMLRKDLEAAGIPYQDAAGRVADFHSLRHTFISNLTRGGVSPKVAQSLARHRSIGLTMDTYTHIGLHDERAALGVLPSLPGVTPDERNLAVARKTGTDDLPVGQAESAYKPAYKKLTKTAYSDGVRSSAIGNDDAVRTAAAGVAGSCGNCFSDGKLCANGDEVSPSVIERSRRDSNPRYLSVQRFSRPSP